MGEIVKLRRKKAVYMVCTPVYTMVNAESAADAKLQAQEILSMGNLDPECQIDHEAAMVEKFEAQGQA